MFSFITFVTHSFKLIFPLIIKVRLKILATIITILLIFLDSYLTITIPIYLSKFIKLYKLGNNKLLIYTILMLSLTFLLKKTIPYIRKVVFFYVSNNIIKSIRVKIVNHLHSVPVSTWSSKTVNEITNALSRVSFGVRNFLNISVINTIPAEIKIISISYLIILENINFIYVPLSAILIHIAFFLTISKLVLIRQKSWNTTDKITTYIDNNLRNTKFHRFHLNKIKDKIESKYELEERIWLKENTAKNLTAAFLNAFFYMTVIILFIHMTKLLITNKIGLDKFILIKGYALVIGKSISKITQNLRSFAFGVVDMSKVIELLQIPVTNPLIDKKSMSDYPNNTTILQTNYNLKTKPLIKLSNISFENINPIFKNFSLDINHGEKILITGKSGIGKSTLCQLLSGLLYPNSGYVYYKGIPMHKITSMDLANRISFIDQDAELDIGTIRENIESSVGQFTSFHENDFTIYNPSYPEMSTKKARLNKYYKCKLYLNKFPSDLDKNVGDRGKNLSGGERQRILLNRAVLNKPDILILDEALCYLDEKAANAIINDIFNNISTVIMVTHRKHDIKFTRNIVLNDNTITHRVNY